MWWQRVLTSVGEAEIRRAENEVMAARAGLELLGIVAENWRRRFYNAALQAEIERVGPDGQINYIAVQLQAEATMLVVGEVFGLPQVAPPGSMGAGSVITRRAGEMPRPHNHHVVFQKGIGKAQQELAREAQTILRKHGIDPLQGVENLVQAPNIKGQHTLENLKEVVDRLKAADQAGATRDDIVNILREMGEKASQRR